MRLAVRPSLVAFVLLCLAIPVELRGESLDFAPINLRDEGESMAELQAAQKAYKKRNFLRASLILHRILSRNETAVSPVEQKAEYTLGKTLYRLGLFQASLNLFDRVVQTGTEHRYFKATCKWLYFLSRKLSGDPGLLEKIAKYDPGLCPAEFRSELAFLRGQYHYSTGQLPQALEFLRRVKPDSRYFPKAKFLEGISHVRLDKPKPAVESFKDLLRVTVSANNPTEDLKYFNQLSIMSMARVFYSTRQFPLAVKYYDQVPLDSQLWLDALFESSWAFFRMNNHEKAMGNLQTLNSPFFKDEYYPEAQILAAVIFYANCNYDKARDTINSFRIAYEPLRDEIKSYLESFADQTEFYNFFMKLQESDSNLQPRVGQIVNAALQDKQLRRMNAYVRELDREIRLIDEAKSNWTESQLAQNIVQELEVVKSLAVHEAGRLAKTRLARVVRELNELISQSLKIEFEVASAEKGVLENRLQGQGMDNRTDGSGPKYATDDEHIYWSFNGEYWRDELGYYLYTIRPECTR